MRRGERIDDGLYVGEEVWCEIGGWEGFYEVSSFGRVKGLERVVEFIREGGIPVRRIKPECIMAGTDQGGGYRIVLFQNGDRKESHLVHRLVATAFIANPLGLPEVNHLDFDKGNNKVENLEWCTREQNRKHAQDGGRMLLNRQHGEKMWRAKLTEESVIEIRRRLKAGHEPKAMAEEYGVTASCLYAIGQGRTWHHLPSEPVLLRTIAIERAAVVKRAEEYEKIRHMMPEQAVLTFEDAEKIRAEWELLPNVARAANKWKVSRGTIRRIMAGTSFPRPHHSLIPSAADL